MWQSLPWTQVASETDPPATSAGDGHLSQARDSLRDILDDSRVPAAVREALADDYAQVERMLDKLEHGHIHIAAFGRVGVGKSSMLNALLGEKRFAVSALHGETRVSESSAWTSYESHGVYLIDTPGINEIDGQAREQLAREVAARVDMVIFVVDGDLTETELDALRTLKQQNRPILLVLNKTDRYNSDEIGLLHETLVERSHGLVAPRNIVAAAANPAEVVYVRVAQDGNEERSQQQPPAEIASVKERIWEILEAEGQTLAALNASLFAGDLSDKVAARILETRKVLGDKLIRTYSVTKGVAVAFNPVPVADLFAAAVIDGAMIWHLSRLYDLPLGRGEASSLASAIVTQLAALMGTVWAVHFVSSALKIGTAGVSTVVTAGAQGAVAYYATFVVGKVAEEYLVQGKSWGEGGPKLVVQRILDSIDRDSILSQAREDIRSHLRGGK
ncbi:MAG: GTP-binding protein [Gammaproteobacteria bacterium]|nr:GTP-binding protein [Gammaproteobacteria bacterium]NND59748.1 DUF697 domain-containing protein [Gammaproteobacteria bacterium]